MNAKIAPVAASLFVAVTLIVQSSAQADAFGTGSNQFTVDFVKVGNTANTNSSLGYGAVPYEYRIGKYEIAQHQVTKATQLGLTGVSTTASSTNRPAASATWYEAAAFVNFLNTNSGKTAAYNLSLSGSTWSMTLQATNQAWTLGGTNLYRNKDAFYFLPSENEWFKAAYYSPTNSTYYTYPLGSNSAPTQLGNLGGTNPGTAVYLANIFQGGPAEVERAGGLSPYGAMGLAGNAWDWVESSFDGANTNASANRTFRGAAAGRPAGDMISSYRQSVAPTIGNDDMGFRVASILESSSVLWSSAGGSAWLTATNWTGGAVPFSVDIAQFGANPTSGVTPVGIDMGSNGGAQSVGAIEVLSDRSAALIIANSSASAAGTLTLLGATVNSTNNVVLRNNSAQSLTLADGATRTMGVVLGNAADNVVAIDGTGGITISSSISGSGRKLTKSGIGDGFLTLSGANTFSGATTVSAGTLRLNSVSGALGSTASVSVASGATLLISQSNQVNNNAAVTLSGGTISRGSGVSETFGALTLTGNSFLNFGGVSAAANLTFGTLSLGVYNVSVSGFALNNQLKYAAASEANGLSLLSSFSFDNSYTTSFSTGTFTITAIPEPSTYVVAIGLLALLLWPLRRRFLA